MPSIRAHLVVASLRAQLSKRFYANPETMRHKLKREQHPRKTKLPLFVRRKLHTRTEMVGDMKCHILAPRHGGNRARLLHLHGGGFVEEPERHHWRFVTWLVENTGATVVFPIYPLCPAAEHHQIRRRIREAYDRYLADHDGTRYVFGDSAGGALTLDLTATLRARSDRMPTALGLLSPWLDIAVSDPRSEQIDPDDPELAIAGLRQAGEWYAGDDQIDSPGVSPLYADLTGFPPIAVCTGTSDILNPDAHRVRKAAKGYGVRVEFHQQAEMFHNWTMHRIPEGARARAFLGRFLRQMEVSDDRAHHR